MRNEEHQLQCAIVEFLRFKKLVVFSIPNHGIRTPRLGAYFKREGLLPGVADLFVMKSNFMYHGIFIEVKSKTGRLTKEQQKFMVECANNDYAYWIIRDTEDLVKKLVRYELNN